MSFFKHLGSFMMMGARAHAKWELNVSNTILGDKKRLIILGLLTIPVILGSIAFADQIGGALPELLGGKKAYSPAFYSTGIFIVSILIGMGAGLITGCIGAGGGFIIAPALMSAGIKGILAVGTDLFHIFAKAIMGSVIHRKLGNVSVPLAIVFLIGAIIGATAGGVLNRVLYEINPVLSDAFITTVYSHMLGFLGTYALTDFLKARKAPGAADEGAHGGKSEGADMGGLPAKIQSVKIPPLVKFDFDLVPGGQEHFMGIFSTQRCARRTRCRYYGCRRRLSDLPHICLCFGRFINDHGWNRYFPDRFYGRLCINKPVCYLRLYLLYTCHGHASWLTAWHSDRCLGYQSCSGYHDSRLLCNGSFGWFC